MNKLTNPSKQQQLITQESHLMKFKPPKRTRFFQSCDSKFSQSSFCTWTHRVLLNL